MFVNRDVDYSLIKIWLICLYSLLITMVLVGGLTRLTDSGLSITKWELFSGILPPIGDKQWENYFLQYKKIPEFIYQNNNITIDEFKVIFYWEYFHRLLGRIIGVVALIPLVYFFIKFRKKNIYLKKYLLIFFLVCLQGFIGWYMVQSGLTERVDVSHYRLALHLFLAFVILSLSFWYILELSNLQSFKHKLPQFLIIFLFLLLLIQIIFGAFLAGLDGGLIYNTWPDMNGLFFPDDISIFNIVFNDIVSVPSLIQFVHRKIAYLIFILILYFNYTYFKNKLPFMPIMIFNLSVIFQIFLGIITLLSGAKIIYASLHQIGSIFVVSSFLYIAYRNSKLTNSF